MNAITRGTILLSISIFSGCAHAYRPAERTPESHLQRWSKAGIAMGADLHDPIQLNEALFEGRCVEAEGTRFQLGALELAVRNDSAEPIQIAPEDITLSTDVTTLSLRVIDDGEAEGMLKNPWDLIFDDWCVDPSLPWEPPILWAGNLLFYPLNFQRTRVYREAVVANGFRYGVVAPGEHRQGLVYLDSRRQPGAPFPSQSARRRAYHATVIVRGEGGGTSRADFTFVRP